MDAPAGISTLERDKIFREISGTTFDVLVIGGGIMGAGIALDAASRGLKVLLVEKQDFAAGTSSRSTKLIHGGLRYLKNFEFGLVREVASERKILHRNAPHLILPEPMLIPLLEKTSYGYWATKAGLTLYDWLGNVDAPECHRMLNKKQTLEREPLLNPEKLKGAGFFTEYRTDDARLTIEVLKTASAYGAVCLNYCELTGFTYAANGKLKGAELKNQKTGATTIVNATCLINATGPWSSVLMQQDKGGKSAGPEIYHTKGVHLVVPFKKLPLRQSVYFDIEGGRMLFAIPRNAVTYLGTTDTPFKGKLENPEITTEDARYILAQINQMFPAAGLSINDVVSGWAGVRALLFQAGKKPSEISRKDEIFTSASGLITVAGGKLTGYRKLAEQVTNTALKLHFPEITSPSQTQNLKLSGGNFENSAAVKTFLNSCLQTGEVQNFPAEKIAYLVRNYGANARVILQKASQLEAENSEPESSLLRAEIWYAIHAEGATSLSDFLIRRTGKLYFDRPEILQLLPEVKAVLQEFLSLTGPEMGILEQEFMAQYRAATAFLNPGV